MKLLIVEDENGLAELLAELLRRHDAAQPEPVIEVIKTVGDLTSAIDCVHYFDAVICDGNFPMSPHRSAALENWAIVATRALKANVPIVIYSGNADIVHTARMCGLRAIEKPGKIEDIYLAVRDAKAAIAA